MKKRERYKGRAIMNQKKNLIVIIGPNAVGKSSVAKSLLNRYPMKELLLQVVD